MEEAGLCDLKFCKMCLESSVELNERMFLQTIDELLLGEPTDYTSLFLVVTNDIKKSKNISSQIFNRPSA